MNKDAFLDAYQQHRAALDTVPGALDAEDLSAWRDALVDLTRTLTAMEALWAPDHGALATEAEGGNLS